MGLGLDAETGEDESRNVSGSVVLLIDPDGPAAARLTATLEARDIGVCRATTAAEGKAMARDLAPDVVVLELALPDADGLVVCADLKSQGTTPIIVYTERDARERVLSLRLGADDAIAKSADLDEVVARIEVALRRVRATASARARAAAGRAAGAAGDGRDADEAGERYQRMDDLEIDRLLGRVTVAGRALYLSATEYRLLSLFLSRPGEVLTREELSQLVFGQRHVLGSRSIDMHVRRLRAKLDGLHATVPALPAVRGQGYRLVPKQNSARRAVSAAA